MTQLVKISKNFQITIPAKLREGFGLAEGDYLEVSKGDGGFLVRPKSVVSRDPDQAWFWTKDWQKKEREAEEDIRAGRVKTFNTMEEGLRYLKKGKA
jgi:AbrB family looped-hinge helix DNA binding protein